ncbi:MAG: sugar phosphate isomerase/epimerase family protein [Planctomycetota bacterium]
MSNRFPSRRQFVASSAAAAAIVSSTSATRVSAGEIAHETKPRRLLKTLKMGMVRVEGDLTAKFKAAKEAGFDGIEIGCPGAPVEEIKKAVEATGLVVDGSVGNTHWKTTHSHADAKVREKALKNLEGSIRETKAVGGHTVLLVVGVGKDGSEQEVWDRSIENIRKALPLCAELGVAIAIENVWNQFCYEHNGPNDQSAEKFVKYVDEFKSPWVGMQFDIGNHWKYGNPAEWIRTLGKRIIKFDIKGFHRANNKWADITEDDLPWADVRKAIDDIGFHGWIAAEVGGGNEQRLKTVADQIDNALNIG